MEITPAWNTWDSVYPAQMTYLPLGLTVANLVAYATGLVTFLSVVGVWRALLEQRPAAARNPILCLA